MANPATGAEHRMGYVAESTIGTTPATPAFKLLPFTGTSLQLTKDAIESEELGSRKVQSFRHGNRQVGGNIDSEFNAADFLDPLQAVYCGTWAADTPALGTQQLKTGSVRRGFTVFRQNQQFTVGSQFNYYTGCEFNEFSLTVTPNSMVTVTFGIVGVDNPESHAEIAGSTYTPRSTEEPFDSFTGWLEIDGTPVASVTQIELSIANGIEPSFVLFSPVTGRKSIGKTRVTGNITSQLIDYSLYDKFRSETAIDLVFQLESPSGAIIKKKIPNLKLNSGADDVSGDGEITLTQDFVSLYDSVEDSEIVCEYTPAP